MLVSKFSDVEYIARSIDTRCRCGPAKMWDSERQSQSPAVNVTFSGVDGENHADVFVSEASGRGWLVKRNGPNDVYVDPEPEYKITEEFTKKPSASF